jgi:hypothetical protein
MPLSLTADRIGLRRWCSITLALALVVPLAAACTKRSPAAPATTTHVAPIGATAPVDATAWALADQLTQPAYTAGTTAAMVAGLPRRHRNLRRSRHLETGPARCRGPRIPRLL